MNNNEEITILNEKKINDIIKNILRETIPIVRKFKKPILNNQSRIYDTFSERISLNFPKLSLWEIHYYSSVKEQAVDEDVATILYTFKKDWDKNGISSEHLKKAFLKDNQPEYELYNIQQNYLFVFKNENFTLKELEKVVLTASDKFYLSLFRCFKKYTNEIINVKLKDLPQILVLSQGCKFETFALKPKTIVVMEDYSTLVGENGISGNIYLCNYSLLYQISLDYLKGKYIGNNVFLQDSSIVNSKYVGDNVIFGSQSILEMDTYINSHVYITDKSSISESVTIPSFQTITTTKPLILRVTGK